MKAGGKDVKTCEECDKPIPAARLKALPGTTVCVKCSTERPLTENDLDLEQQTPGELRAAVTSQERSGGNSCGAVNWHR